MAKEIQTWTKEAKTEWKQYAQHRFLHYRKQAIEDSSPSLASWAYYQDLCATEGIHALGAFFPGFCFPIQEGISQTSAYRKATLKGQDWPSTAQIVFQAPKEIKVGLHKGFSGTLPLIEVGDPKDFATLLRVFCYKNEPVAIPAATGAILIRGIVNWQRIHQIAKDWKFAHPYGNWAKAFKESIQPNKALYQDTLIMVCRQKPYSAIPATAIGMPEEEWLEKSYTIRLEHEFAHYFTQQHYGHMGVNMHDELIADYMGITKAFGRFDPALFLRGLGLASYPSYRKGGRLENYQGKQPLSPIVFKKVQETMVKAASQLAVFDKEIEAGGSIEAQTARCRALCETPLEIIASPKGATQLIAHYNKQYH